jgi:repressor LexA
MALTRRQKEVLDFIASFVESHGFSPSYEEIAQGLQLASLATVHKHIQALESKTYLKRGFNQSRSIEVSDRYLEDRKRYEVPKATAQGAIPLMGRIAAGRPVEAIADRNSLEFTDFAGDSETFALQVRGESMIEDHICDGDYVLIKRAAEARDGEIVVALVAGMETTLKRFYREPDGRIRLQPANASMEPIMVRPEELELQGKLVAVLRKYRN